MLRRYATLMATVAALAPLCAGTTLRAQVPPAQQAQQQQMQRMQEQVQRLDETMRRMAQIHERAQQMEQSMLQDMARLRTQEHLQVQDQERLRNQEHVRVMAHALSGAAGEMTQAMQSLRTMAHDPGASMNRDMEQQMERLQQHMRDTGDQMEAGLRIMEQLRDRLNGS